MKHSILYVGITCMRNNYSYNIMKKIHFDIDINVSREVVWDAVVNDEKYRLWTSAFHEGSYFEGGWNTGDTIHFLALNDKGEKEGMLSQIAESRFPEYISIRHVGFIMNGIEDTTSDDVKKWTPAYENYTFEKIDDGTTRFVVDMDAADEFVEMFSDMWPKALVKLKEVCEK